MNKQINVQSRSTGENYVVTRSYEDRIYCQTQIPEIRYIAVYCIFKPKEKIMGSASMPLTTKQQNTSTPN